METLLIILVVLVVLAVFAGACWLVLAPVLSTISMRRAATKAGQAYTEKLNTQR